jgi:hypothetical protein
MEEKQSHGRTEILAGTQLAAQITHAPRAPNAKKS